MVNFAPLAAELGPVVWGTPANFALYRIICPVLSVTLVYCDQTVAWIKMKLGMPVGLGPGHIVLDGDLGSPPLKGHSPHFWPISIVAKWLDGL